VDCIKVSLGPWAKYCSYVLTMLTKFCGNVLCHRCAGGLHQGQPGAMDQWAGGMNQVLVAELTLRGEAVHSCSIDAQSLSLIPGMAFMTGAGIDTWHRYMYTFVMP
jgi:hypothetical protein